MTSSYSVVRKLPLDALPAKQRSIAQKAIEDQDARERAASESRAKKAEAVKDEARRRTHDLLGAGNRAALREAIRAEKTALKQLLEPPGGLGVDRQQADERRKQKLDSLIKKLGADPTQLREIGKSALHDLEASMPSPSGTVTPGFNLSQNLSKWTELSPLHKLSLEWGERPPVGPVEPTGWQVFGPPFPFWNTAFDRIESDGFVVGRNYTLFEHHGAVGNVTTMDCSDGDDHDFAHAIVDTEVVFIFEAPASGRLEVIVDAINAFGWHELRIEDEFGWSEQWTALNNYLSLNVYHPNVTERSLSRMSNYNKRTGGDDFTYSRRALTPGAHYYGHMVSNGSVEQGDTFFLGVGTRTFDICGVNDMELHSKTNFQWWIRSVEIRMVE